MKFQKRMTAAAALWTIAGAMASMRSIWDVEWMGVWVVLVTGMAAVPTLWLLVEHVVDRAAQSVEETLLSSDQETLDRLADAIVSRREVTSIK